MKKINIETETIIILIIIMISGVVLVISSACPEGTVTRPFYWVCGMVLALGGLIGIMNISSADHPYHDNDDYGN